MSVSRIIHTLVTLAAATVLLVAPGCSRDRRPTPPTPAVDNEVVGTLVALKDDRPVDGGIDLTLETAVGLRVVVRVPSIFIVGPRDSIHALHQIVDASTIGDRLRARGHRDEDGILRVTVLERLPR